MQPTLAIPLLALLPPSLAFAQVTYGSDAGADNENYSLDVSTGVSTGPVWNSAGAWGLADDGSTSTYYVNDGSSLFSVPIGSSDVPATLLGTMMDSTASATRSPTALAFNNGILYAQTNITPEAVHVVDVVTQEITVLYAYSDTALDLGGLDFDPATGLLYGSNDGAAYVDPMGNSGQGIVTVDLATSTEALLYPYPAGETDIDGLAFDPTGSIYLIEDEPAPLHRFDIATMAYDPAPAMNLLTTSALFSAGTYDGGGGPTQVGTAYCMTVPNSTGASGVLSAMGSTMVAANDITLTAASLPTTSFGFFVVSDNSGFVPNPGGSDGNLCLGGSIGRYVGAGQIQNSGMAGEFSLAIDLTDIPRPSGPVAAAAGETWFFQAWHRDSSMGAPTSNFTNGLEITFN